MRGEEQGVPEANSLKLVRWQTLAAFLLTMAPAVTTVAVYSTSLNPGLPLILGGTLAVAVGLIRITRGSGRYYHWGLDVGVLLLFWALLCHFFGALDLYLSQKSLATWVGAVAMLMVPQLVIRNAKEFRAVAHLFVGIVTVICLLAWPPAISAVLDGGYIEVLRGTFPNPDTFAILPMLAIAVGMGLAENISRRWSNPFFFQLSFLALTLLATGCRSAILGLFVGTAVYFAMLMKNRDSDFQKSRSLLVIPLVVSLLLLPLINSDSQVLSKFTGSFSAASLESEGIRLEVWSNAWKAVLKRPIWGAGPGCFGLSYQAVRPTTRDRHFVDLAHNDHIEIAVELGVLGFGLWLVLWYSGFSKVTRGLLRGRRPVPAAGLLGAMIAIVIYCCFNFIVAERPVFWLSFLILGFSLSYPSSRRVFAEPQALRYGAGAFMILMGLWASWFGYRAMLSDSWLQKSRISDRSLLLEQSQAELQQAIDYQPHRIELRLRMVQLLAKLSRFRDAPEVEDSAEDHLASALSDSPRDLVVRMTLVERELDKGRFEAAEKLLAQTERFIPNCELVDRKQAALYLRSSRFREAALKVAPYADEKKMSNSTLAAIVSSAELQTPGDGAELIRKWLGESTHRELGLALLGDCLASAIDKEQWLVAQSFVKVESEVSPSDYCVKGKAAMIEGKLKGEDAEYLMLSEDFAKGQPDIGKCYEEALRRWVELTLQKGDQGLAKKRLEEILQLQPRIERARLALADIEVSQGQSRVAVRLLRDGLSSNPRSNELVLKLAQVYEQMGSRELAISYYRDALHLMPGDSAIKEKLSQLVRLSN